MSKRRGQTLRDHIEIKHGFAFPSKSYSGSGECVLLTPGNFREEGGFRWLGEKQKYFVGEVPKEYILTAGQMLIAMTEQAPGLLGSTFFVPNDQVYLHNQRLGLITIKDRHALHPEYLHYFFSTAPIRTQIARESAGTKVKHTSPDKLLALSLEPPTLGEQIKIATVLEAWDEAIDTLSLLRNSKAQLRDGILQKLLPPSNTNKRYGSSKARRVSFGTVFVERQDRNQSLGADDVVTVGKYAIRKQSEHFTRSVASSDLSGYWTISPGEFVYDPMSAYYGALGRYTGDTDGIVSPAYRVLRLRDDVVPEFMVYVLKSHRVRFLLETRSSQGNKEGKRRLLQRDEFAAIDFVLPSQEAQRAFVDTVSYFEQDIQQTTKLLKAVQQQKLGLMQKLVTG